MVIKNLFTISLLFFINSLICCKKQEVNSIKKDIFIKEKSIIKKTEKDTLPSNIIEKYKSQKYFDGIVKNDKTLVEDINRTYSNKTEIEYKEIKLDKNLTLCQFIFRDEVQYNYIFKNDKIIFKLISDLVKSKIKTEYKDWNNDKKPELIQTTESCMSGGCEQFFETKSIYEVRKDTLVEIVSLPIQSITCQLGNVSLIDIYQYKLNPKTNELIIKKITGTGDCNQNKIKIIKSNKTKTIVLKKQDNESIIFD